MIGPEVNRTLRNIAVTRLALLNDTPAMKAFLADLSPEQAYQTAMDVVCSLAGNIREWLEADYLSDVLDGLGVALLEHADAPDDADINLDADE